MIQFLLCRFQNQIDQSLIRYKKLARKSVEIFSNNFILLICTVRLMHAVDLSFSNLNILKILIAISTSKILRIAVKYIFICRSRRTVQLQPFPPYNHFYYNHSKYVIKNVSRPIDDRLYECGDKCIVRGAWIE
ncbi:hypothetical protein T09_12124 [Trichinella sp. T9]|uniref:Uncharacterized protein n=1 Tax=Trichinella murrelli TaxID=144512 RepID=A0A0V0UBD2_9BILA|nr:hypothetical protein T05_12705 [Trichinella murrelli]KRX59578.1 hypothetical protein T09_12124 [Trichinella sp. T9]